MKLNEKISPSRLYAPKKRDISVAGHRARDPPEPVPNSEVKLRSVSGCSAVFGRAKPEKLAAPSIVTHCSSINILVELMLF